MQIETVAAAMAGDDAAIIRLLELTQPDIRRFAKRQCHRSSDVDDAVQEALWLLYRRVGMLRAAENLSAWLFTVVRRSCARLARMAMPNYIELNEFSDDVRLSAITLPELRIDVAHAIASLPPHYRQIVLLRDIQEMTIAEIAAELSLTHESVKARLHRARSLLREYLLK